MRWFSRFMEWEGQKQCYNPSARTPTRFQPFFLSLFFCFLFISAPIPTRAPNSFGSHPKEVVEMGVDGRGGRRTKSANPGRKPRRIPRWRRGTPGSRLRAAAASTTYLIHAYKHTTHHTRIHT